jgi:hypothetical protein
LVALAGFGVAIARSGGSSGATPTPTLMPGQPQTAAVGQPIDGIHCLQNEALAYHIHQHIALYLDGTYMDLPAYIGFGITGTGNQETVNCLYWIHVHHETPNFIHVESPTKRVYTLGQFVDIWKATTRTTYPPNSAFLARLESARTSQITVFVNGQRWMRSYRDIPLTEHEVITLEVGKPVVPPKPWTDWTPVD